MNIPQLRRVKEIDQIKESLFQVRSGKNVASLWQNLNDRRVYFHGSLLEIDRTCEFIKFAPTKEKFSLSSLLPLYIYFPYKCTIFKTRLVFNSHFKLEAKWPREIMTLEMRDEPRSSFDQSNPLFVEFIKEAPKFGYNQHFKRHLMDLSSGGLSFKVSSYDVLNFYEGDPISIISLLDSNDPDPIFGSINYIVPIADQYRDPRYFRIGVKFE